MGKVVVYYSSRRGTTKYFGEEIAEIAKLKGFEAKVYSVLDFKPEQLETADIVFMGCWTHGLFFVLQHPPKDWQEFARLLPSLKNKKIGLFCTYKIATGSLFGKMKKMLEGKIESINLFVKSKKEIPDESARKRIEDFIAG